MKHSDSDPAQPGGELFSYELPNDNVSGVSRSRIICTCGHSAAMHSTLPEYGIACTPPKGFCGCVFPLKAMEVSSGRYFFGTNEGQGLDHPLARNLGKLMKSGGSFSDFWPNGCMLCQGKTLLSAKKFNLEGYPDTRGKVSLLVCTECEFLRPPIDLKHVLTRLKPK